MNEAAVQRGPPPPIPITLLTGFLGAGKTTLLNRLLRDPALAGTAVIINEFGEVGLDHLLVEYVSDNMVLLQSGCLCCNLRGDLVDALETLLRDLDNRRCTFSRVLLETTGLADPAPVLHTLMTHPYLVMRYRLDGVVTVVDAINGLATLDSHREAVKQAAVADRLVMTKTDLLDTPEQRASHDRLVERLRALNPAAGIVDAAKSVVAPKLLSAGLYDPDRKIPDVRSWLNAEAYADAHAHQHNGDDAHSRHHATHDHAHDRNRHDDHIRAFAITSDQGIPSSALDMFIELLRARYGEHLLRVKGIVQLAEEPDAPLVFHGVQHVFHPPAKLAGWPDDDHRTRIVFITRDLDESVVRNMFNAFLNAAAIDTPDRVALAHNPLVPFGGLNG